MVRSTVKIVLLMAAMVAAVACDRAQLLAPTRSTITMSAATRVLALGGSTDVTAFVVEEAGTPVQNGTTVRFSVTMGRVEPVEVQTTNGLAITRFFAGSSSGVAEIRAISGAATGGDDDLNVVEITIGAAAANRVTVTATPGSVSSAGGSSQITATALDESGNPIAGVPVTFSSTAGTLSASSANTDENGRATIALTTNREAEVTARVGSGADSRSATVTVRVNVQGTVTLTCRGSDTATSSSCTQVAGSTVTFAAARGTTSGAAAIASARLDFGDGTSTTLGNLASSTTVNHIYGSAGTYTATLTATDANGEVTSASVTVVITRRLALAVTLTATEGAATTGTERWTFEAETMEGSTDVSGEVESYTWDFGDEADEVETSGPQTSHVYDDEGRYIVTVTVEMQDGRTATAREEIIVEFPED
jgi:PKD repeat protein